MWSDYHPTEIVSGFGSVLVARAGIWPVWGLVWTIFRHPRTPMEPYSPLPAGLPPGPQEHIATLSKTQTSHRSSNKGMKWEKKPKTTQINYVALNKLL